MPITQPRGIAEMDSLRLLAVEAIKEIKRLREKLGHEDMINRI